MSRECSTRPDKVVFVGDAVVDRYACRGGVHVRAGCIGNLLRTARFDGNSIELVSSFPDPPLLQRLLHASAPAVEATVYASQGPLNIVEYVVTGGRVEQVRDEPRPCPHGFDEAMAEHLATGAYDVIAVADYGLGTLGPRAKAALRGLGASGRAEVLIDARHANYDDYRGASWFLPTIDEYLAYTSATMDGDPSPARFVDGLHARGVVLKKGAGGLQVIAADGLHFELPGLPAHRVVDSFGAGDMLLGGLATRIRHEGVSVDALQRVLDIVFDRLQKPAAGDLTRTTGADCRSAAPASMP